MKEIKNKEGGFFKVIGLFVVFALTMWYFKIDVRGFVESHPEIKTSFEKIKDFLVSFWNGYLRNAFSFIWNDVMVGTIWERGIDPFLKWFSSK